MHRTLPLMVALTLVLSACATDDDTGLQRGTGVACTACTSDFDCAQGLLCDQDAFACKSVEQLKAKKTGAGPQCDADCWQSCKDSGACASTVTNSGSRQCAPRSGADCQASTACQKSKQQCNFLPGSATGSGVPGCQN